MNKHDPKHFKEVGNLFAASLGDMTAPKHGHYNSQKANPAFVNVQQDPLHATKPAVHRAPVKPGIVATL